MTIDVKNLNAGLDTLEVDSDERATAVADYYAKTSTSTPPADAITEVLTATATKLFQPGGKLKEAITAAKLSSVDQDVTPTTKLTVKERIRTLITKRSDSRVLLLVIAGIALGFIVFLVSVAWLVGMVASYGAFVTWTFGIAWGACLISAGLFLGFFLATPAEPEIEVSRDPSELGLTSVTDPTTRP